MNKRIMKSLAGAAAGLMLFAYTGSAQLISYVDATHGPTGNTQALAWDEGGQQWLASEWNPTAPENPGGWNLRSFANNSTIYENAGTTVADDAHPLLTTVSGLNPNTYNVFVYFWSSDDGGFPGSWPIRATLDGAGDPGPWTLYNPGTEAPVTVAVADNFTESVMVTEGNRTMFQAHIGEFTGTEFSVFINDLPKTSTDGSGRTWYDGVGYSVVPEPSTYALLAGLGALAFIVIRRRFRR